MEGQSFTNAEINLESFVFADLAPHSAPTFDPNAAAGAPRIPLIPLFLKLGSPNNTGPRSQPCRLIRAAENYLRNNGDLFRFVFAEQLVEQVCHF